MDKKLILLGVAAACVGLYFYGSQIKKDNQFLKSLPIIGGIAFGLNTLIQMTQSEEDNAPLTKNQTQKQH